jgi:succinate dehydrogenase/fumarate reductase cytochrome b subunit
MENVQTLNETLINKGRIISSTFLSFLIESIFLLLWVLVNYLLSFVYKWAILEKGINEIQIIIFQIIFALSTLFPILIHIYVDIRVLIIRAKKEILKEKNHG